MEISARAGNVNSKSPANSATESCKFDEIISGGIPKKSRKGLRSEQCDTPTLSSLVQRNEVMHETEKGGLEVIRIRVELRANSVFK